MILSRTQDFGEFNEGSGSKPNSWYRLNGHKPSYYSKTKPPSNLTESIRKLISEPEICILEEESYNFNNYSLPDGDFTSLSSIPPPTQSSKDVFYIDTLSKLQNLKETLISEQHNTLAFDLEMYGYNPQEISITCLIQLRYGERSYIIDVLSCEEVWVNVGDCIGEIFEDHGVIKIGHGINMDVNHLSMDFGITINNVFDTYEASRVLGLEKKGLADVCKYYGLEEGEEYKELKGKWQVRKVTWSEAISAQPLRPSSSRR